VGPVAELLRHPASEIRRRCEEAGGAGRRIHLLADVTALAPVDERTEVWAAGVTYELSQRERMKESVGAAVFYHQV
jgi:2-dehydro-3-deoxy-D-arabinonate dehydratase